MCTYWLHGSSECASFWLRTIWRSPAPSNASSRHRACIEAAETGEDALELLRHYEYDIVLLNLALPDMDGARMIGRIWRKLHLAVDAGTGEIAAHVLTDGSVDDPAPRRRGAYRLGHGGRRLRRRSHLPGRCSPAAPITAGRDHSAPRPGGAEHGRSLPPRARVTVTLAAGHWVWAPQPRRDHDGQVQASDRPQAPRENFVWSARRGRDRRHRAQPDDPDRQTRLRSHLIFRTSKANYEPPSIPAPTVGNRILLESGAQPSHHEVICIQLTFRCCRTAAVDTKPVS